MIECKSSEEDKTFLFYLNKACWPELILQAEIQCNLLANITFVTRWLYTIQEQLGAPAYFSMQLFFFFSASFLRLMDALDVAMQI